MAAWFLTVCLLLLAEEVVFFLVLALVCALAGNELDGFDQWFR